MFARLMVRLLFRSEWDLKQKCYSRQGGRVLRRARLALYAYLQYENNSSIAWNSTFKGEPCFPHGMKSIFVSGAATLGRDCVIFQQVTIGSNTLPDSKGFGAPTIGDRCYVGAGAKIVGRVLIGDDVRIGANAVVSRDVPSRSVVVPGEQVIYSRESLDNRFYSFRGRWMYFSGGDWHPVVDAEVLARLEVIG